VSCLAGESEADSLEFMVDESVWQYTLKSVLEPIASFRKVRADIGSAILLHQAKITNARADKPVSEELKSLSVKLRVSAGEIPCYNITAKLVGLPSNESVVEACRELNGLADGMNAAAQEALPNTDWPVENTKAILRIGELLEVATHS
jgi:hypothetical protein